MITPDFKTFEKLAKKGNVIPVYREILADLETPASAFLKLNQKSPYAYLLESVEGQENVGRYSFLAVHPSLVFESKNNKSTVTHFSKGLSSTRTTRSSTKPLSELKEDVLTGFRFVPVLGIPRFCGGLVGYIGYDMVRFYEKLPDKNPDELKTPDCVFMLSDTYMIFDHVNRKIKVVANALLNPKSSTDLKKVYKAACLSIEHLVSLLKKPIKMTPEPKKSSKRVPLESNMTKKEFCSAVSKAKEYIRQGDIIQVVLSQRFKMKAQAKPFDIYRSLRAINPSPYMFYLKCKDLFLVGSSPELLVRCEDGVLETRPIAGTRPRGKDDAQDGKLAKSLLKDEKEKAEHLMLVDLGRNDLGRVSKTGSVKVEDFMGIEKYSHVMHMVSRVTGRLSQKKDAMDALIACFPAGTVAGAPKIRAMEIIDELENVRRGPYAGAIGYFSFSGNLDSCIIIRTIIVKNNTLYIQAGAGIVADSVPEREYQETVNKAKALFEAAKYVY